MDIVERLRNYSYDFDGNLPVLGEAADEIERLREALKKMNDEQCQQIDMAKQKSIEDTRKEIIARAALKEGE